MMVLFIVFCYSLESFSKNLYSNSIRPQEFDKSKSKAQVKIEGIQSSYSSTKVDPNHLSQLSEVRLFFSRTQQSVRFNYDLGLIYTNEVESYPYFDLKQIYYPLSEKKAQTSWVVGKKLHTWSEFDRLWKLGIWEPILKNNYLRPERQGLTGLFMTHRHKRFRLTGFLSPFFIPDMGPQIKVKDGQLFSSNRWFQKPIGGIEFHDQSIEPVYALHMPEVSDVLLNFSMALSMKWGGKRGPWSVFSLANKPMNQMQMLLGPLQIILEDDVIPVNVYPTVGSHSLISLELGWRSNRFNSWLSLTQDRPNVGSPPEGYIQPAVYQQQFIAINIEHDGKLFGQRDWKIRWGAFKRVQRLLQSSEGEAGFEVDFSNFRYPFEEATMLALDIPMNIIVPTKFSTQLMGSPTQKGAALIADFTFKSSENLNYHLGFDIIGADDPKNKRGFFNQYQNNDRFYAGLSYVF